MAKFYTVNLPKCPCGKPATKGIQAVGNVWYARALCDKCCARRLRELEAAYKDKPTSDY